MLNTRQKVALWAGISLIVLIGLFPPHLGRLSRLGSNINMHQLAIRWVIVAAVTVGVVITLHDKRQ